jgi:hypothetical protein
VVEQPFLPEKTHPQFVDPAWLSAFATNAPGLPGEVYFTQTFIVMLLVIVSETESAVVTHWVLPLVSSE